MNVFSQLLPSCFSSLLHRTDVTMVTAVGYLSINNPPSFSEVSWELNSFKELLQTDWQHFRGAARLNQRRSAAEKK